MSGAGNDWTSVMQPSIEQSFAAIAFGKSTTTQRFPPDARSRDEANGCDGPFDIRLSKIFPSGYCSTPSKAKKDISRVWGADDLV